MSHIEAILILLLIVCVITYCIWAICTNDMKYDEYVAACKRDNVDLW